MTSGKRRVAGLLAVLGLGAAGVWGANALPAVARPVHPAALPAGNAYKVPCPPQYTLPGDAERAVGGARDVLGGGPLAGVADDGLAASWMTEPGGKPAALSDAAKVTGTCPMVLAEGDSVTSGHNIASGGKLLCEDPTYSYAYRAWVPMRADDRWKNAPYVNAAFSGFGTKEVLGEGDMKDACKQAVSITPVDLLAKILHAHAQAAAKIGNGNIVMQSAGINDAPWTDKLGELIKAQDKIKISWPRVQIGGMSKERCDELLPKLWNPVIDPELPGITKRAGRIAEKLIGKDTGDPNVKIFWLKYYDFAGSGYVHFSVKLPWGGEQRIKLGPLLPASCSAAFAAQRDKINNALAKGVSDARAGSNVTFVDTGLDGKPELLQNVIGLDGLKQAAEALVVAGLKKIADKLKELGIKALLEAIKVSEDAIKDLEKLIDKLPNGPAKDEAKKKLEAAKEKLEGERDKLAKKLEETVSGEGKIDWEKAGLKPYWELGWPHPNAAGHATIANKILDLLGVRGRAKG